MELGIKQLITVVLTLLVAVSLLAFAERINETVDGAFEAQISAFEDDCKDFAGSESLG